MNESSDYRVGRADGIVVEANQRSTHRPRPFGARIKLIWIGTDGLRAGWAALFFLLIVAGVLGGLAFIAHLLHHLPPITREMNPRKTIIGELAMIFAGLVATMVMSRIDKRPWLDYGLRAQRAGHLGQGLIWGVVMMSAMMAILRCCHAVTIERSTVAAGSLVESAVLWAIAFALVAVNEELTFRGYAFFRLLRGTQPLVAALVTSSAFALAHIANPTETISGMLSVAVTGLVFCLSVWRTGSLWWVIGFHAAWDWSQSFLFGVADSGESATGHWLTSQAIGPAWLSGGSAGPEGSVLVFPILAALALVIVRTLPPAEVHLTLRKPQTR
jgi:uncharacterized protein